MTDQSAGGFQSVDAAADLAVFELPDADQLAAVFRRVQAREL